MRSGFLLQTIWGLTLSVALIGYASGQSLDAAVNAQLERINFGCDRLLNNDPANFGALTGELAAICARGSPAGGDGASDASGGAAATPASMPAGVKDRLDDDDEYTGDGPVRGFFATFNNGRLNRSVTPLEDGYKSDLNALLVGFDHEFGKWVAGITLEHAQQDGDFSGGGDFEVKTSGVTLFLGRGLGEKATFNVYAGYNKQSNERLRLANFTHLDTDDTTVFFERDGTPQADFDATQNIAGFQFTYDFEYDYVSIGPIIALDWQDTEFDAYTEFESSASGLALNFHGDARDSLISTVGLEGTAGLSTKFGGIVIGQYIHWKQEHSDEQRLVDVSFADDTRSQRFSYQTESPDESHMQVGVNATFLFHRGLQIFIAYDQKFSHDFLDVRTTQIGFRKEF